MQSKKFYIDKERFNTEVKEGVSRGYFSNYVGRCIMNTIDGIHSSPRHIFFDDDQLEMKQELRSKLVLIVLEKLIKIERFDNCWGLVSAIVFNESRRYFSDLSRKDYLGQNVKTWVFDEEKGKLSLKKATMANV